MKINDEEGDLLSYSTEEALDIESLAASFSMVALQSPQFPDLRTALLGHHQIRTNLLSNLTEGTDAPEAIQETMILNGILLPFFHGYLSRARTAAFRRQEFDLTFARLQKVASESTASVRFLCPLAHVSLGVESVTLPDGNTIRRVSQEERERWLTRPHYFETQAMQFHDLVTLQAMIEIERSPENIPHGLTPSDFESTQRICQLLSLLLGASVTVPFVEVHYIGITDSYRRMNGASAKLYGPVLEVDAPLIDRLLALWTKADVHLQDRRVNLALRRWTSGGQRRSPEDQLIDYWVALESLFIPDGTAELSYRASLRIAAFVGNSSAERQRLYEEARKSYRVRSLVVHGDTPRDSVAETANRTGSILRQALLSIIESSQAFKPTTIESDLLTR